MPQIRTRLALPAILVMVALAALAIACADEKTATTSPSTPTASATTSATASETAAPSETATASETAAPSETGEPGEAMEIEVDMKDNFFEPTEITVPANTPIQFKAKNTGTAIHNMHILSAATEGQDFSSDTVVAAGTESEFTATFTQAGTVQFQCDFHVPDMVGTITVQ